MVSEHSDAMDIDIDPQLIAGSQPEDRKTKSNLRLFPPPLFSRQGIPQNYLFALFSARLIAG